MLAGFCTEDREMFDGNTIVDDAELDSPSSGLIYVSFTGSLYLGCRDRNRTYEYTEDVVFRIDHAARRISFNTETPELLDRSPNEEF